MKIIVDEIPKRSDDCLFSEYQGGGYSTCLLNDGKACEENRCQYLKSLGERILAKEQK